MRISISTESPEEVRALLGLNDANARLFRRELNVAIILRKGELQLEGDDENVEAARDVMEELVARYRRSGQIDDTEVARMLTGRGGDPAIMPNDAILKNRRNRNVTARTKGQRDYIETMERHEVVFAIGPAGTGKTYLAVAMAVRSLREGAVTKIVLTRPAVEAGEKLGFLPGSFEAKVNPYLRPLYDALHDLVDPVQVKKFMENDVIEIAPLAYMRGRTLSDAFIILDEAQNTTPAQMKMVLTRMGEGSRMVVTGDVTQIDLPSTTRSGLIQVSRLLQGVKGVGFSSFSRADIVRHDVVQRIVERYQQASEEQADHGGDGR